MWVLAGLGSLNQFFGISHLMEFAAATFSQGEVNLLWRLVMCDGGTTNEVEQNMNLTLKELTCVVAHKTEVVLFTTRGYYNTLSFLLKDVEIRLCTTLKYLQLWVNGKLSFHECMRSTAVKIGRPEQFNAELRRIERREGAPAVEHCHVINISHGKVNMKKI